MKKLVVILAATVVVVAPGMAQLSGGRSGTVCTSVTAAHPSVTADGRLSRQHLAGPPNFESIRTGDKDMPTLILTLPHPVCIDDGGDFADPKQRFRTVQIWSSDPRVRADLKHGIGRRVIITGEGYAANNAMHFAPLVLNAKTVTIR